MPVDLSRASLARLSVTALLLVLLMGMGVARLTPAGASHDGYADGYNSSCDTEEGSDRVTIDGAPLNVCISDYGFSAGFDKGSHDALTNSTLFLRGEDRLLDIEPAQFGEPVESGGTITKADELDVLVSNENGAFSRRATITRTTSYAQGSDVVDVRYDIVNPVGAAPLKFRAYVAGLTHLGDAGTPTGTKQDGPPFALTAANAPAGAESVLRSATDVDHFSITDGLPATEMRQSANLSDTTTILGFSPWTLTQHDDRWDTPLPAGGTKTIQVSWKLKRLSSLLMRPYRDFLVPGERETLEATYFSADGTPVAGKQVQWVVAGANPNSGSTMTGPDGKAAFTYTAANEGTDRIVATATDGDPAKVRTAIAYRRTSQVEGGGPKDDGRGSGSTITTTTTTTNTTTTTRSLTTTPVFPNPVRVVPPAPATRVTAVRLAKFLAGGLRVRATATSPSRWRWDLYRRRSGARAAQTRGLTKIASASDRARRAGERVNGTLRVSRKTRRQLRRARRVTLVLRTTVTPDGGAPVTGSRTLVIKR